MGYEYEEDNIRKVRYFNVMSGSSNITKPIKELEEVYAKARAFDKILKLEKETSSYSIVGKEDLELGIETRKIINKYMEDK